MNERQLAFFKERLKQLEQDILANAGETTEHLRKPSSCRTLPTAPRSRKNTRWNCARAIASASCSRRCNSPSPASTAANTAGEETGEPIGIPACWPAPRPPCRWKRRNAAKCVKNSTAIELAPKRLRASPGAATDRKVETAPSATRFPRGAATDRQSRLRAAPMKWHRLHASGVAGVTGWFCRYAFRNPSVVLKGYAGFQHGLFFPERRWPCGGSGSMARLVPPGICPLPGCCAAP